MKTGFRIAAILGIVIAGSLLLSSFEGKREKHAFRFPYQQAGLTEAQAAAHLLSRFTYGATPGQVQEVVSMGLENWFRGQLKADLKDDSLQQLLGRYDLLQMNNSQIVNTYPRGGQLLRLAVKDGFINKDSVNNGDRKMYRSQLQAYMQQKGLRPEQDLVRQFTGQKIIRAAYTENQLQEVLTDFWFNHFNVSFTKNDCSSFIPNYERDVIRPNALGRFGDLLEATAKSPAMLVYLDNFSSSGVKEDVMQRGGGRKKLAGTGAKPKAKQQGKKGNGLNENYAREIMELHTLGVDGGYTQQDVTQAARVLTGWTLFPMNNLYGANALQKTFEQAGEAKMAERGYVHEGDFLFVPTRHDNKEKTVLGKRFAAGGGYEEGKQLLEMLAHHASTARFISKKLAVRFVSDAPSQSLIDKMASTFQEKKGDIRQVLITMVSSPEFWNADALREKTKSPFELAISSVRALGASIQQPNQLYGWINRMGQKMYYYQAPTGFPDKGQYWINTGSLLNRMNFGLALASQRIPGISFSLLALNNHHEPESAEAALMTYGKLFMPERNLDQTIQRLKPMLTDPGLQQKIEAAANKTAARENAEMVGGGTEDTVMAESAASMKVIPASQTNKYLLPQVVGIIIGSPEFQRK